MKSLPLISVLVFHCLICLAQNRSNAPQPPVTKSDAFVSRISMTPVGNDIVQFSAKLPPLRQLAGAPKAYYSYFWDFGDGSFNDVNLIDKDKPKHRYAKSGEYLVRLLATNNYAAGISPTATERFVVKVNPSPKTKINSDFFGDKEKALNIKMKVNRNPKPEEDLMAYIGYRNRLGANVSGSLIIFFNDQRLVHKSFGLTDKQTYNNESVIGLDRVASQSWNPEMSSQAATVNEQKHLLNLATTAYRPGSESETSFIPSSETRSKMASLKKKYLDYTVLNYDNLNKDEERFIFFNMQTLPDIIKDTNDNISMTAMIVPNDRTLQPELFQLTIQVLVSHDPNQMHLLQNRINYRFMGKKKELTYKVEFQNIGKGPATNIALHIALPRQLNSASLQINEVSPGLISCDSISDSRESCISTIRKDDSIYVTLKNIYLPGLEQNLVKNEDSTKGFIKYTIKFNKKPKKIPFSSRAVIKFDNNKPIYTNDATVKFIKGISPGVVAGYNLSLSSGNYSAKGPVQIGYFLAPYSPSRPYFQMEIYAGFLQQEEEKMSNSYFNDSARSLYSSRLPANHVIDTAKIETVMTSKRNVIQLVPLHFRYNINDWISVGAGIMGQIAVTEQKTSVETDHFLGTVVNFTSGTTIPPRFQPRFDTLLTVPVDKKGANGSKTFTEASFAPFADVQVGRVRKTGPFAGLRFYRQLSGNVPNRFFLYAGFRL